MKNQSNTELNIYKNSNSIAIFGIAALLLWLETKYLIPLISLYFNWETIISWFVVSGLGMFLPMVIISIILIRKEGLNLNVDTWVNRLRFKKITREDLVWAIGSIVLIGIISFIIMEILRIMSGQIETQPDFMEFNPLNSGRYWILFVWFPYWLLNILGEEILWRGVLLPKQEIELGRFAWIFHGFLWGIFHLAFGWNLLITLLPILFIQSYVVQKRKNSWIGVIIHATINGPSFIAISFGLI